MDRYRKLKVIGKGSFGYAVQVQSVADRHTYVMKVSKTPGSRQISPLTPLFFPCSRSLTSQKWTESSARTLSTR